ncbi:V-type ATP synthase subunit E [Anaerosporobacter faecicola]|uniref:V-type ATP synthase subunit E n=1 Tax=Anaerosporobacter faecicola TaxID=2718714 RepID=UPI00143AC148|nr:V-type ATP synthase subunit E [Anaerosporobacter faecicola]
MTLDEKLDNFYQSAIDDATAQSVKILESYEQTLQKMCEEKKAALLKQAELKLRTESENLIREKNKNLSNESVTIKRNISTRKQELVDRLFLDVEKQLSSYMKTTEYKDFLIRKIKEAVAFSNGDDMLIYINPTDESMKQELEIATNTTLTVSNIDFVGGIRSVISSRHILIDFSFSTKLKEEKANFKL